MAQKNLEELTERLKSYVPFLQEMIGNLKTDMPQHSKIVALLNMITETRKKFKYETLKKCEEVILKMQTKTNYKNRISSNFNHNIMTKPVNFNFQPLIPLSPLLSIAKEGAGITNKIHTLSSTPASPEAEVPTIRSPDPGTWEPPDNQTDRYVSEMPCIYSKAAESVGKSKRIQSIVPELDTSKPPISLSDLETLKSDVMEIICDKKVEESKSPKQTPKPQSKVSLVPAPLIKPRSKEKTDEGNTNVETKVDNTKHSKESNFKEKTSKLNTSDSNKNKSDKKEIIVKDGNTKFASLLSSIDDQILTVKNKRRDSKEGIKKDDDRKKDIKPKESKPNKPQEANKIVESKPLENGKVKSKIDTAPVVEKEKVFTRLADKYNPKPRKQIENKVEESHIPAEIASRDPRMPVSTNKFMEPPQNFNYKNLPRLGESSNEVPRIPNNEMFTNQRAPSFNQNPNRNTEPYKNIPTFNNPNKHFINDTSHQDNSYDNQRNIHGLNQNQHRFQPPNPHNFNSRPDTPRTPGVYNDNLRVVNIEPRNQFNEGPRNQFNEGQRNQFNDSYRFPSHDNSRKTFPNNFGQNTNSAPYQNFSPPFQSPEANFSNQNYNAPSKSFNPYDVQNEYDLSAMSPIHYDRNNQTYHNEQPKSYKTWREERESRDPRLKKDNKDKSFVRSKSIGRDDDRYRWKKNDRKGSPENNRRSTTRDPRLHSKTPPRSYSEHRDEKETFNSPLESLYTSRKEAEARVIQNFKIPKKTKASERISYDFTEDIIITKNVDENKSNQNSKKHEESNKTKSKKSDSSKKEDKKSATNKVTSDLNKNVPIIENHVKEVESEAVVNKVADKKNECQEEELKENESKQENEDKTKSKGESFKISDKHIGLISDVKIVLEKCPEISDLAKSQLKELETCDEDNIEEEEEDTNVDDKDENEVLEINSSKDAKKPETIEKPEQPEEKPSTSKVETKKYIPKPKSKQNKSKLKNIESEAKLPSTNENSRDGPPSLVEENRDEDADEKKTRPDKKILDLSKGVDKEDLLEILANLKGKSKMENTVFGLFGMLVNLVNSESHGESSASASTNVTNNLSDDGPPLLNNEVENEEMDEKKIVKIAKKNLRSKAKPEETKVDKPIESVGERIKNRKRQKVNPSPPKRARRNELDKLHEDIKETLGDDVLTSRRACTRNEAEAKRNIKPPIVSNENLCEKAKGLRVVLEKMDEYERPKRNAIVKEETNKRRCTSRTTKMTGFYTESDDLTPPKLDIQTDVDKEEDIKGIEEKVKSKTLKRKKSAWAFGVIKKKKKSPKKDEDQLDDEQIEDEEEEEKIAEEESVKSDMEEETEYVEPDIDYYLLPNSFNNCGICDFKGKLIIQHYISAHPKREIVISKLPPKETKLAVEESERLQLDKIEPQEEAFGIRKKRFHFICRFCNARFKQETAIFFHDHLTQHTGELRFKCNSCNYKTQSKKNFNWHNQGVHKNEADLTIDPTPINFRHVFGYVCSECNFLQLHKKTIADHIKIYHLGNNVRPIRINMSYPVEGNETDDNSSIKTNETSEELQEATVDDVDEGKQHDEATEEPDDKNKEDISPTKKRKRRIVQSITDLSKNDKEEPSNAPDSVESSDNTKEDQVDDLLENEDDQKVATAKSKKVPNKRTKKSTWSPRRKRKVSKTAVSKNEDELEDLDENKEVAEEETNSVTKEDASKPPDFTAFLGIKDIVEEELNLEQIRLNKMKEIEESLKNNRIVKKRTSFVNELKTRLETETKEKSPKPETPDIPENIPTLLQPKLEPPDYQDEPNESFVDVPNNIETSKETNENLEELNKPAVILMQPSEIKKESPPTPPPLEDAVPKENTVTNIVNRLQEKLIPRAKTLDNGDKIYSVGIIEARVSVSRPTIYYCRRINCIFNTAIKSVFESHCKLTHKSEFLFLECEVCFEKHQEKEEMIKIFHHLQAHIEEGTSKEIKESHEVRPETPPINPPALSIKITNVTSLAPKKENLIPPLVPIARPAEQRVIVINSPQKSTVVSKSAPLVLNQLLPTNLSTALTNIKKTNRGNSMVTCKVVPLDKNELNAPRKNGDVMKAWLDPLILQRLLKCPLFSCMFTTECENEFESHLNWHDCSDFLPCLYCNFKMKHRYIKVHYMMRHAKSIYGCSYCLYRAVCVDYIQIHQEAHHKFKPTKTLHFKQDIFSNIYRSPSPPQIKSIMKPFICCCQKQFYAINNFENHLKHKEDVYKCSLCKTVFLKPSTLIQHFQMHQVYAYNCRYCSFAAQLPEQILKHIAAEHSYHNISIIWRYLKNKDAWVDTEDDSVFDNLTVISPPLEGNEANNVLVQFKKSDEPRTVDPEVIILDDDDQPESNLVSTAIDTADLEDKNESIDVPNNTSPTNDPAEDDIDLDFGESSKSFSEPDQYQCYSCKTTFNDPHVFKSHLVTCSLIEDKPKPYGCVHCNKWFKNSPSLLDHVRIHGVEKITCSLCSAKFAHPWHARSHMKTKHTINNCSIIAADTKKTNSEVDEFVIKPYKRPRRSNAEKVEKTLPMAEPPVVAEEFNPSQPKQSFSPEEIHLLPVRPIFSKDVFCSICNFGTKVRTNLVRHMQLHKNNEDALIPMSCPVNPVPCLEKNELMFDKMTNLANSSYSRMGGKDSSKPKEDDVDVPAHIPSNKRYVCGANNCNYLCLEESMLRHHLQALHWHESVYVCTHCQEDLCVAKFTLNIDDIIKHIRLHEGMLYRCGHCKFFHNLKNKVEKHSIDKHADKPVKIITIREENESGENEREKRHKPWRCGMCKARYLSKNEAKSHVQTKHGLDYQYKCNYCNYSCSDNKNYTSHHTSHHSGLIDDVVVTYFYEEEKEKEKEKKVVELPTESFDTTPLWSKNKNNVKHIRGILIEEQEKLIKRSPIKIGPIITPEKKFDKRPSDKKSSDTNKKNENKNEKHKTVEDKLVDETKTTKKSNLDFCIEAVATGNETCASLRPNDGPPKRIRKKRNEDHLEKFEFVNISFNEESPPILFKAEPRQNDSVVDVDESLLMSPDTSKETATTIHDPSKTDLQTMPIEKLISNNFMGLYGPFGKPYENMFQCPLCAIYQTKELMVFEIHLMEELDYKRYSCDICQHKTVTFVQMGSHYVDTHGSIQADNISSMLRDEQIDVWIQNVILLQERLIKHFIKKDNEVDKTASFFNRTPENRNTNEQETTSRDPEDNSRVDVNIYGCSLCNFRAKYPSNLKEHMVRRHAFRKPFQCPYCIYSSVRKSDCLKHVKNLHKTRPEHVIFNKDDYTDMTKMNSPDKKKLMKQTARKSTSVVRVFKQTARKSTGTLRKLETPYSFYGQSPDITENELKTITTVVPVMNNSVSMTINQLQKIFDIFPEVSLVDIEKTQL